MMMHLSESALLKALDFELDLGSWHVFFYAHVDSAFDVISSVIPSLVSLNKEVALLLFAA